MPEPENTGPDRRRGTAPGDAPAPRTAAAVNRLPAQLPPKKPAKKCEGVPGSSARKKAAKSGRKSRSRTDLSMKTVFTTGEAAKICKVSSRPSSAASTADSSRAFRVPGSRFRRIPREVLFKFMKENGIPTDALESGKRKALVVDDDESLVELIRDVLEADGRFDVRAVNNGFDAGITVKEYKPDVMILDIMLPDINGQEVCERVRADGSATSTARGSSASPAWWSGRRSPN